jgi:hypothetical protein
MALRLHCPSIRDVPRLLEGFEPAMDSPTPQAMPGNVDEGSAVARVLGDLHLVRLNTTSGF